MKKIKIKSLIIILLILIFLINITSINAFENETQTLKIEDNVITIDNESMTTNQNNKSSNLENKIYNANNGEDILIEPGIYTLHNIQITKNITLQGHGNPRDIIIDGEKKSSIFLIKSPDVHVTFKNITFINGLTDNFGGAISIETGNVYVDNCIFINNTALKKTNAGAISNYGTKKNRGYLFVNNSFFMNNHADHDGGAITTCYANSDIYNCVFINNTAVRDGGAIRVSVYGYGNVQDCIFMFNHADEWGGAYYSWSGESNIERCIFMNNTAGTNGGAVMVSGNINIEDSIIVNNDGGETGGSFYIQQPMYDTKTTINVHNNIITNNSSPYGKEVFIKWWDAYNLYTNFNDNDWGDEDPNDSDVNDPDNVTSRIKVSRTIKSDLFNRLNVDLLDKYKDLIGDFFPNDSLDSLKKQFENSKNNNILPNSNNKHDNIKTDDSNEFKINNTDSELVKSGDSNNINLNNKLIVGNSTTQGDKDKSYELNESRSVPKESSLDIRVFVTGLALVFILLAIGYKRNKKEE